MNLLPDEKRTKLLDNGRSTIRGEQCDHFPVVKLYTPDANVTWLLTELDPKDGETAYGLIDTGLGTPELMHVRLSDLESIRGPRGLPIARDPYFTAKQPLSEYVLQAQVDGSITD